MRLKQLAFLIVSFSICGTCIPSSVHAEEAKICVRDFGKLRKSLRQREQTRRDAYISRTGVCRPNYTLLTLNLNGVPGPTGPAGPAGVGGVGVAGVDGVTGATGVAGVTGATGAPGTAGALGATGATGAQGSKGENGAAGEDLYTGVLSFHVNKSLSGISAGQGVGGSNAALLRLLAGSNSVGAFNGGGTGNKAFLGFYDIEGLALVNFQSMSYTSKRATGLTVAFNGYVNFLVDLNCNAINPSYAVIVVDYAVGGTSGGPQTPGADNVFNTYTFQSTDAVFKSVGGAGGLPLHTASTGAALSTLTGTYPSACFVKTNVFDGGMPRNTSTSPVLIVLGDSATTTAANLLVDDVSVTTSTGTLNYTFD